MQEALIRRRRRRHRTLLRNLFEITNDRVAFPLRSQPGKRHFAAGHGLRAVGQPFVQRFVGDPKVGVLERIGIVVSLRASVHKVADIDFVSMIIVYLID